MKKVLFIIAQKGFQPVEYGKPKKILEEAGFEIVTASNLEAGGMAVNSMGGEQKVDLDIKDVQVDNFDAVIFVGGPGAVENLDNDFSYTIARAVVEKNKILGAICIAPTIIANAGVLRAKKATVWTSNDEKWPISVLEQSGANYIPELVVRDGNVITANGPGAAEPFGEALKSALL